jgi:biopolymer transport protein TolQ
MSVATWAIFFSKWIYLSKLEKRSSAFLHSFLESRSMKELNNRLDEHSYSPLRVVFQVSYAELLKNYNPKDPAAALPDIAIGAAMDNLKRSIHKTKLNQRRQLERFLSFLAISASSCPFIGLFGTVWGIMSAFEGIAQSGSTSLATVAPGISEALIATAFGLAAAIPAVVGYNIASHKIRNIMGCIDLFTADFLNIIERFFVSERGKNINTHDHGRATPGV